MNTSRPLTAEQVESTIAELAQHAPFDRMAPEHLRMLAERLELGHFPADAVIARGGTGMPSHLYIIKRGAVMIRPDTPESAGAEFALQAGECFPLGALLGERPISGRYTATRDTSCYLLPAQDFRDLLERSPVFHDFCTRRVAHLLQQALATLQSDVALNVNQRQPLERRLAQAVRRAPVTCREATPIREALETMARENIGSMLIASEDRRPLGIFTLRDLLARVALGEVPLSEPIARVMTRDPVALHADAFAFEAALAMSGRGIHHIVVVAEGRISGLVSEKDLFALQRVGLKQISSAIAQATRIETLAELSGDVRELARNLLAQGVSAEHLTQIIATLNDRLSQRVIALELDAANLRADSLCWIALGSEGRHEQTLASDQDNGIIFPDPPDGDCEAMRARLTPVAQRINQALAQVGFPLCRGNIMAGNPKWCLSLGEWREAFARWISHGDPEAVLNATIFFDFRPLAGEESLAVALREWLSPVVRDHERFLHQLAENALGNKPPLGILRDFTLSDDKAHPGTIDLKVNGSTVFIDAARVYALASGVAATNTAARLREAAKVRGIGTREAEAWVEAFHFLQLFRLRHQHGQLARGEAPDNYLNPDKLNDLDRRLLKESLRTAKSLQQRLAIDFRAWGG